MSGLRELGKALGLGLGVQITGPAALTEVARLTAERDALIAVGKRQAARLARVEALAEEWDGDDSCDNRTCVPTGARPPSAPPSPASEADTSEQERPGTGAKAVLLARRMWAVRLAGAVVRDVLAADVRVRDGHDQSGGPGDQDTPLAAGRFRHRPQVAQRRHRGRDTQRLPPRPACSRPHRPRLRRRDPPRPDRRVEVVAQILDRHNVQDGDLFAAMIPAALDAMGADQ